jgi:hypothetical protein
MSGAPIDVLVVIDRDIERRERLDGAAGIGPSVGLVEMREARATIATLIEKRDAMAPLCRDIVAARTEADELRACKALASWLNDDLDASIAGSDPTRGWMPIETAPRDRRILLCWSPESVSRVLGPSARKHQRPGDEIGIGEWHRMRYAGEDRSYWKRDGWCFRHERPLGWQELPRGVA